MAQLYSRHSRYANFDRLRHGRNKKQWIADEAKRLGKSESEIFDLLKSKSAEEIEQTPTPPPPPPQET